MKTRFFGRLVFMLIMLLVIGVIVMLLWNWLLPGIFAGVAHISYWQALGIFLLSRLLFGSFFGRIRFGGMRHEMHGRNHIREKWMNMTPEQRNEFINKRREHFTRGGFFGKRDFDPFASEENAPKEQ
jgi:hypothetical protein